MKIRLSFVALFVACLVDGGCGSKEPAATAGPAPVAGTQRKPTKAPPPIATGPRTAPDDRQPRRDLEAAPAPRPTPKPVEAEPIAKTETPDKAEKLLPEPTEVARTAPEPAKPEPTRPETKREPEPTKVEPEQPEDAPHKAPKGEAKYEFTITDMALTNEIADRIPTERKKTFAIGTDAKVIAWFEAKNAGDKIPLTLVWKKNGREAWHFDTEIGKGKNWRTWAEKKIGRKDAGKWTVELVDDGGFVYEALAYEVVAGTSATAP